MAKNPLLDLEDRPSSSCTNPEIAKKVKFRKCLNLLMDFKLTVAFLMQTRPNSLIDTIVSNNGYGQARTMAY